MAVSKVILNGVTQIDLTQDSVAANNLLSGETAHNNAGVAIEGSYTVQTQTKSVSPSETAQTVTPDTGKYLSSVSVGAISSSYVGTGVARKSSTDLTASGATVTAPAGYYENSASKSVASGSATAPASISGTSATVSTGTNTLTLTKTVSVTPSVTAGYISSGTAGNSSVSLTASVTTKAAATITPGTSNQTIASGTYLTGTQTISGDANLVASNIKSGTTIFGVTGTYSGGGSSKNIQVNQSGGNVRSTTYTSTGVSITVAKAGTYKVTWTAWRSSSSGTMGTNLYKNSTAGTANQTWTSTYGQHITLSNQTYAKDDVLTLYATSGSTSRYCYVGDLVIVEQ